VARHFDVSRKDSNGRHRREPTGGLVLAATAAVGLGLAVAISRFAYEGGTNGLTVATSRSLLTATGLALFCLVTRRGFRLGIRDWLHSLGLGLLAVMMFYGNIGAVEFIPINLTSLLFFTYPPMIAVLSAVVLRESMAPAKAAAIAVAFAGLALMLGVSFDKVDPRGIALALAAAVSCAWNAVWLVRKLGRADIIVVTFHMTLTAALALVLITVLSDQLRWPTAPGGWAGLAGVTLLQGMAVPIYFVALPLVGALKSGIVTNVQPLITIAAAYLLFGEVLSPVQGMGGCMVLGGLWLAQWSDARALKPDAPRRKAGA
jgi:DME family drug/metabolite transporter